MDLMDASTGQPNNQTRREPNVVLSPPAERPWPGSDPTSRDYADFRGTKTPIVIDNGSWEVRAGWATEGGKNASSKPRLQFPNVASKFRDRKTQKGVEHAGHDATSPYADVSSRLNLRSPFEGGAVMNADAMECILDYTFFKMGLSGETKVDHPIVMTEPVANLNYSRKVVTELLFESYNVPSVAYGIDALFSYHANTPDPNSGGLIVSSSYENTYVLPYAPGNTLFELVKRITFGGSNASSYFLSLLQAKYPAFPVKVTFNQAESMLHEHGYLSMDYLDELRGYDDPETREERDLIVQFPYSLAPERAEKTDEEKARMEEKKKEQGKRLQEQAARKKQEKIDHMEAYIGELKAILELKETDPKEYSARLKYQNLRNESALAAALAEVEADLHKTRTGSGRHKKKTLEDYENEVAPPTDMLEFPDDTLTPEQLREKRRQRTMKANWDARERARKERDLAAKLKQEKIQREIDKRTNDFAGWLEEKHKRRQELVERQLSRKKLRAQLQDRRSQASKAKMRTVAQLAKDDEGPVGRRGKAKDDGFGQDDSDWNVYHEISKDTPEDEEAELAELGHLDELLNQYDPGFKPDDMDEDEKAMRQSIVYRLAHGAAAELGTFPPDKKVVAAKANQIHLNVERIRVPEVLFQPSIVGLDQAGIVEIISQILRGLDPAAQDMLMRNVLITGTHTLYPNLVERLEQELRSIRPVGSPLVVRRAVDPRLDAWRGAAMWAASSGAEGLKKASLTRKEYLEAGEDYLKEFAYSNRH